MDIVWKKEILINLLKYMNVHPYKTGIFELTWFYKHISIYQHDLDTCNS